MVRTLSASEARRIALGAQGFSRRRPIAVAPRQLHATMAKLGALQIDSVNVFARAHYMPMFARLGNYDPTVFDRVFLQGRGHYVEYLPHEAAFIHRNDWPLWRFRMDDFRRRWQEQSGSWFNAHRRTLDWVLAELRDRGPLRPADIRDDAPRERGGWWNWDDAKTALEVLWRTGDVAVAGRRGFERTYAAAEQVIPREAYGRDVARSDAVRELVRRAANAYGVATEADLADYYRLRDRTQVRAAIAELVEQGELTPVEVRGWERGGRRLPTWLHRDAVTPRRIDRTSLLSPFDPLVWHRDRALRLFGLDYRIEIYTPAPKRRFGYYCLPVLVGEHIVARLDLKADRANGVLLVQSAHWESDSAAFAPARPAAATDRAELAQAVADEIALAARWQGLAEISVSGWGDASGAIALALDSTTGARRHRHPREATLG